MKPAKAYSPINVTLSEIVISDSCSQLPKAYFSIVVTPSGITSSSIEHPRNAFSPIEVTLLGNVMLVTFGQSIKAFFPIRVIPSSIIILRNS